MTCVGTFFRYTIKDFSDAATHFKAEKLVE